MKPIRLVLHNFGSHIHSDISFDENESLIGVIGRWSNAVKKSNGSGKSTFVDGILFALYGKSRVSGSSDNVAELVREGHNEMQVDFEFIYNNQNIRIDKSTIISDSGKVKNKFRLWLNGVKKSETPNEGKAALSEIFDIEYEVFVATSFFAQGKSDEFIEATSSEKQEYLRKIDKEVAIFEKAKKFVTDDIKINNDEFAVLSGKISYIEDEINSIDVEETQTKIDLLVKEIVELNKDLLIVEGKQDKYKSYEENILKVDEYNLKINNNNAQVEDLDSQVSKIRRGIIDRNNTLNEAKTKYTDEVKNFDLENFVILQSNWHKADTKYMEINTVINSYKENILPRKELLTNDVIRLKTILQGLKFDSEAGDRMTILHDELKELNNQSFLYSSNEAKIEQLKKKKEQIKGTKKCLYCLSDITQDFKNKQLQDVDTEITSLSKFKESKELAILTTNKIKELKGIVETNDKFTKLDEVKIELDKIEPCKYSEIDQYDADELRTKYREEISKNQPIAELKKEYNAVKESLLQYTLTNKSAEEQIISLSSVRKGLESDVQLIRLKLDKIEAIEKPEDFTHSILLLEENISNKQGDIREEENKIKRRAELLLNSEDIINKKQTLFEEGTILKEVQEAFSKDGIPYLITQNTLQTIENHANDILEEINSGMEIEFITQKETKTGNINDVVELIIKMGNKVRNYKTYSGGEKTLINFAVRMGISLYLTNKTGCSIEMVILDEVFAALDEENRGKIFAVLNFLKNRFSKIIAISHTGLRDIFPSLIEFERDEDGTRMVG